VDVRGWGECGPLGSILVLTVCSRCLRLSAAVSCQAWHGLSWMAMVRPSELAAGDALYSPFVAAGWDGAAERNVRPAQWLGLLKILACWGAEFFYTGFFSLGQPFPNPSNWIWQAAMPSYAQAVTSLYSDLLFEGTVMRADDNTSYSATAEHADILWAGAPNHVALARRHKSKDIFVIAAAINRVSNQRNNSRLVANVSISLPGGAGTLRVPVRLQGSVFLLDRTSKSNPKLVQLDAWHESTHPYYWAPETRIEAELCHLLRPRNGIGTRDPTRSTPTSPHWLPLADVRTEMRPGAYDFTSFAMMSNATEPLIFEAHCAAGEQRRMASVHVWLRARRAAPSPGTSLVVSVGAVTGRPTVFAGREWQWKRALTVSTQLRAISLQVRRVEVAVRVVTAAAELDQLIVTCDDLFAIEYA
jgi:hypothetical protein